MEAERSERMWYLFPRPSSETPLPVPPRLESRRRRGSSGRSSFILGSTAGLVGLPWLPCRGRLTAPVSTALSASGTSAVEKKSGSAFSLAEDGRARCFGRFADATERTEPATEPKEEKAKVSESFTSATSQQKKKERTACAKL